MKNTLAKAQNIVNAPGYSGPALVSDKSNYFEIVSENYLGSKQHYQFHFGDLKGSVTENGELTVYHWGSKCSAVGVCDPEVSVIYNELSEIPRSYYSDDSTSYRNYFNWYSATAESGTYSMTSGIASDSVCPKGWKIPTSTEGETLYTTSEGLTNNANGERQVREKPLSMTFSGYYDLGNSLSGGTYPNSTFYHWYSDVRDDTNKSYSLFGGTISNSSFKAIDLGPGNRDPGFIRANGMPIRCIKR